MELVCPAGNFPMLKAAIDNGADAVYIGFKDATNARHFPGLNFTEKQIIKGIQYAHQHHAKIYMAINTYPQPNSWQIWQTAIDNCARLKVDAIIVADIGVLDYATENHPDLARHLSVQASATNYESLNFYHQNFGIKRAVIPRVLSMAQIKHLTNNSPVDIEVFGFGSLCVMVEGRCFLSSYVTGQSPNTCGVCSPANAVEWQNTQNGLESRLNGLLVDCYKEDEAAGYPTICKGRFNVADKTYYALEEPTSLNTLELLPQLKEMGIKAIKIEGRQRSSAYVKEVAKTWRQAIDQCMKNSAQYVTDQTGLDTLKKLSEGSQTTYGAYHRPWQ
ncbi:MAG: U32 family peptidase [Methylococcales bacterium]|jgi:O2-independent ubiquinone biosynthesis protein UbiU|nr:U32 family peptidase [Methylococcales bacterium]MBT7410844.1 U32 family peptidase [Methylococcales bacterium]